MGEKKEKSGKRGREMGKGKNKIYITKDIIIWYNMWSTHVHVHVQIHCGACTIGGYTRMYMYMKINKLMNKNVLTRIQQTITTP